MTVQSIDGPARPVTVLGLGRMGTALAGALLAAGHPTTVWNRDPARVAAPVARGAVAADTVGDAILASPLVLVTVTDYRAVHEVLGASAASLTGRTVVNLATGTPEEVRAVAERVAAAGADYLDGAMMALPQTVATPEAFFLYSGSRHAFDAHRTTLDVLATSHFLDRDPAVAELWDLALLGSGYAVLAGFLHSLALLHTAQVPPTAFVPLVTRWLHGMLAFMPELAEEVEFRSYGAGVSPVALNRVAVGNLVRTSTLRGVDAEVHAPLRALLDRRTADGHGTDSFASLFELLKPVRSG
ncbi:NAD(P)-dependent oxidoreductase [Plantactinospora sonchi]|uniref:NAD(P)-binding domain-containing protein n=1 Tax=Plantactinospora sonchi TaxID=1544735 RepID=A0ABU7RMS4_9ACTN